MREGGARRDGGPADGAVHRVELRGPAGEDQIGHFTDFAQGGGRNPVFQIHIAEHPFLQPVPVLQLFFLALRVLTEPSTASYTKAIQETYLQRVTRAGACYLRFHSQLVAEGYLSKIWRSPMKSLLTHFTLAAVAAIASLPALAVPTATLRVSTNGTDWLTGGTGFTVTDNGAGDIDGTAGTVSLINNVSLAGWRISFDSGTTKNELGTATLPKLLTSATITRTDNSAGTLFFEFFDTGFLASDLSASTLSATVNGLLGSGSGEFAAKINDNPFLITAPVLAFNGASTASTNVNGSTIVPLTPYKLTLATKLTVAGLSTVSLNSSFTGVPEPGFYGVLAIGLSGLAVIITRRRATEQA